jgi:hypothetical protein
LIGYTGYPAASSACTHAPPLGLHPDQHLVRLARRVQVLRDQLVEPRDPGQTLRQPLAGQHPPRVVFDLDVVVSLSPVIADK